MRCTNCGWDNPSSRSNCIKCNSPLCDITNNRPVCETTQRPVYRIPDAVESWHKRIICRIARDISKIITRSHRTTTGVKSFYLVPQPYVNAGVPARMIKFDGDYVILNRDNLETNSSTIAKWNHAVVYYDGKQGCWTIQNKSPQQFTFVHCRNKMPIADGDKVLMGDRVFDFHPLNDGNESLIVDKQQSVEIGCKLLPIPYPGAKYAPDESLLMGQFIEVNRQMIDADNFTISCDAQADFSFSKGVWYVQDCSKQKTTFLSCASPVALTDGDAILLGRGLFIFEDLSLFRKTSH